MDVCTKKSNALKFSFFKLYSDRFVCKLSAAWTSDQSPLLIAIHMWLREITRLHATQGKHSPANTCNICWTGDKQRHVYQ
jgi:hypothetical protein